MVFKQYSLFLPSYLGGENIRRHGGLIERSDRYLDGLVELFGLWDKLERPILIKREQPSYNGVNKVTLYVNTHSPITEIIIEGDIEETITPPDSVTTSYEKTWTINNPSIEIYSDSDSSLRMPSVTVTVRTETHTYTKAYPENDTIQNNSADHDIFLDIVGSLLGIPRRQYATVNIPSNLTGRFSATVPPYMAKEVQTEDTITILPCTEDDYYYYERLNRFIQSPEDHLRLFHTIYDPQAVILKKEDNIIPSELVGTETTVIFTHIQKGALGTKNSLNIDTTNVQQMAEQTLPITRPVQIYPYATIMRYYATTQEQYVNRYKLHLTLGLNAKTIDTQQATMEVPIANLPVNITYEDGTELGTFITDETGTAHVLIDGARSGQQKLHWDLTREYPYFDVTLSRSISYNASLFKLSLDDGAWQYKIANGTGVTNFEDATILSNNNLNCGTGYMTYTPAINPALVDLSNYSLEVTFHYTTNDQRILLGTLEILEGDIAKITGLNVQPRAYASADPSITDTHTLTFLFTDGVCKVYYDSTYTGVSKDFNGTEEMLYLAGYNSRANAETYGLHIEEIRAEHDSRLATMVTCTTINSTTGSASVEATLTSEGSGVSGATIQCKTGTSTVTSATTDSNGVCTLDLSSLTAGSYNLTVQYDGDSTYGSTSTTHTITIINDGVVITDDCTTLNKWLVSDTGNSAYITSQTDIPCLRPPTTAYQRVYWKYPLKRGTNSSIKFKVYNTTNANGIILGTMEKYGQDHMTSVKSWWAGLGSSNNWTDGPVNSQNRHGGTRMSYNSWHTIEFELEDNLLHTYVDDVSVRDYTIPSDLSSNPYFNDYFFIGFSGNGVWIRDIEYNSNTSISDDTLNSIRSAHLAQFE